MNELLHFYQDAMDGVIELPLLTCDNCKGRGNSSIVENLGSEEALFHHHFGRGTNVCAIAHRG